MNTGNKQFDDTVKAAQEQIAKGVQQIQPSLEKLQETAQATFKQVEPQMQKAQEAWNQALAKVSPELASTQESIQAQVKDNMNKLQQNLKEIQTVALKQPFNPFEIQNVVMAQQLDMIKQMNRQMETHLEAFFSQVTTATDKVTQLQK